MKSNYLYLGIAAMFITFAGIQLSVPGLLPFSIYYYVAWASFSLALFELLKAAFQAIKRMHKKTICLQEGKLLMCDRHIISLSKTASMTEEANRYRELKEKVLKDSTIEKNEKKIRLMEKAIGALTIVEIIVFFVAFAQAVLRKVPNDIKENRTIGILGLLTIALLFVSYFITNRIETEIVEVDSHISYESNAADYYLDLIDKIAASEPKENNK